MKSNIQCFMGLFYSEQPRKVCAEDRFSILASFVSTNENNETFCKLRLLGRSVSVGEECGRGMRERNVGEECGHPSSDIHIDIVVSSLAHSHLRLTKMSSLEEVKAHADAAGGPGHLDALFLWLVAFAGDPMAALADIDAILASCQGEPSTDSVVAFAGGPMAALADNDAVLASRQGEPSTASGSDCQWYPDGKHLNKNKATPMVNTANTQRHENGQDVKEASGHSKDASLDYARNDAKEDTKVAAS